MTVRTSKSRASTPPRMTAHHYEYLAWWLRNELPFDLPPYSVDVKQDIMAHVTASLATHLKGTNPRFDVDVFLRAVAEG